MTNSKKPFQFKKFTVEHDKCAMKVGFDGALLGAWATHPNPEKILDIGTGSGLIALILRQRFPNAIIHAIEPNQNAIHQAKINFDHSPFDKSIELFPTKLQNFLVSYTYDLILSNPPFFTEDTGSVDDNRNEARQEKYLPLNELLNSVKSLLNKAGKFIFVYPTWETKRVYEAIKKEHLFIVCQTTIYSSVNKPSKRTIFEIQKAPCSTEYSEFVSGNQDIGYTPTYKKLMQDFYTIF